MPAKRTDASRKISRALSALRKVRSAGGKLRDRRLAELASDMLAAIRRRAWSEASKHAEAVNRRAGWR